MSQRLNSTFLIDRFFSATQEESLKSTCQRRKCGAVLVREGEIIGRGFNSPPRNLESQRRCHLDKDSLDSKVTDKTCCIHAEQRAISDAKNRHETIEGAVMYFTSVDNAGNRLASGKPYCTSCSKMALDEGVKIWILEHEIGIFAYSAEEYNNISFGYRP